MGKSKAVTVGYEYYAGMHIVACHGPVDRVHRIVVGERDAWEGAVSATAQILVDNPDLFGGKAKEGGVQGSVDLEFGEQAQGRNTYLSAILGANVPAHIGVFGMVLRRVMLSMMNPYIKPWSVEARRIHKAALGAAQWYDAKAGIEDTSLGFALVPGYADDFSLGANGFVENLHAAPTPRYAVVDGEMRATGVTSGSIATFTKTVDTQTMHRITVKFKVVTNASDDAVSIACGGFAFIPSRENAFDPAERPFIRYNYGGLVPMGSVACTVGVWYELVSDIDPVTLLATATITAVGGALLATYTRAATTPEAVSAIVFTDDPAAGGCTTYYDDLALFSYQGTQREDMNPAHIVRECLTNNEWGLGYPTGDIDDASFTAAADTLYTESFGLSLLWDKQSSIQEFLTLILRHIDGLVYVDPATGLFSIKLIRGDYTLGALTALTEAEVVQAESFARTAASEMYNTVTVQWLDRNNKRQTATARDLAGLQAFGQEISTSVDMPGITRSDLAQRIAFRELGQLSRPLAKLTAIVTRAMAGQKIGGVLRVTLPDYALADQPMRILGISYGDMADGKIRLDLVEDVFSLPAYTYIADTASEWAPVATVPAAAPFRTQIEAPYWQVIKQITGESAAALAEIDPDGGFLLAGASDMSSDTSLYEIWTRQGAAAFEDRGNGNPTPGGTLTAALSGVATSITFATPYRLTFTDLNKWGIIEPGTAAEEIIALKTLDTTTGIATIARGILDTVPHEHAAGARVFLLEAANFLGNQQYLAAEALDVKTLVRTSQGLLAQADAPTDTYTFAARFSRPYPPGNMKIDGVAYPTAPVLAPFTVTWAHRDRTLQTVYLVEQSEASIGPEATTTYNGYLIDDATDIVLETVTGLTGTTWSPTLTGVYALRVEIEAERGGYVSWQRNTQTIFYGAQGRLAEDAQTIQTEAGDFRRQE